MTKDTETLFRRFENLTASAWIVDCNENASHKRLSEAWEKQREARTAMIKRIEELEQCLAHDSAP